MGLGQATINVQAIWFKGSIITWVVQAALVMIIMVGWIGKIALPKEKPVKVEFA